MEVFILFIIAVIVAAILIPAHNTKQRRETLMRKYGNAELVERIMRKTFWQGQTQEQLLDSLGRPLDIDQRILKAKTKETWKYNQTGKNRFALRIMLEGGIVVGWDQK